MAVVSMLANSLLLTDNKGTAVNTAFKPFRRTTRRRRDRCQPRIETPNSPGAHIGLGCFWNRVDLARSKSAKLQAIAFKWQKIGATSRKPAR
jgi:hypothetical protein